MADGSRRVGGGSGMRREAARGDVVLEGWPTIRTDALMLHHVADSRPARVKERRGCVRALSLSGGMEDATAKIAVIAATHSPAFACVGAALRGGEANAGESLSIVRLQPDKYLCSTTWGQGKFSSNHSSVKIRPITARIFV